MTVTLTDVEQRLARFVAHQREAANRDAGIVNARIGPQSDQMTDLLGVGGEIAFARLFNVYPDLTIGARAGGADCTIGPYRLDVKTTHYAAGRLLAHTNKSLLAADVYALLEADFPRYRFCGFARAGDLLHPSRLMDLGHGPTYGMPQVDLRPDLPLTAAEIRWG